MDDTLRRLQLTQLELLKIFDRFCREHELRYSLYAGTLLGAVRHKAFIPWDDDLDVCMPRADYERFLFLWNEHPQKGYLLQNKENAPVFCQSFSKLRKDHTTFLEVASEAGVIHTGIFIDIFPIDRIPNGSARKALFTWRCMLYQLLTREFTPSKSNPAVRMGSALILKCIPKKNRAEVRRRLLDRIKQYDGDRTLQTVAIEVLGTIRKPLAADLLDEYVELPFEDGKYMCFAGWDGYLRRKFGDYMQLPPEEERMWKHHPILIDFEHNYGECRDERDCG